MSVAAGVRVPAVVMSPESPPPAVIPPLAAVATPVVQSPALQAPRAPRAQQDLRRQVAQALAQWPESVPEQQQVRRLLQVPQQAQQAYPAPVRSTGQGSAP
ncbi:MAG: hypothetical protein ACK58J_05370 [Planctomyces sp.]